MDVPERRYPVPTSASIDLGTLPTPSHKSESKVQTVHAALLYLNPPTRRSEIFDAYGGSI